MSNIERQVVATQNGVELSGLLFLLFLALKLTGFITWSWWWVTAPLWMPIFAVLAIFVFTACVYGLLSWVGKNRP